MDKPGLCEALSPSKAEKKILPSPTLSPRTKLSPLASLHKNSPSLRGIASSAGKKMFQKPPLTTTSSFKLQQKKLPPEEKKSKFAKNSKLKPSTHSPWIKPDTVSTVAAPFIEGDVVRTEGSTNKAQHLPLSQFNDAKKIVEHKDSTLILCACGCPCESINDTQYKKQCSKCITSHKPLCHSGYLYEKEKFQLRRYWYKIGGHYLSSILSL